MEEKILQTKKNGMVMLLLTLLGYAVTVLLFFYSIILLDESLFPGILLTILSIAYWVAGIFLLCGLKVLKPQEALVLTLFGDYITTPARRSTIVWATRWRSALRSSGA